MNRTRKPKRPTRRAVWVARVNLMNFSKPTCTWPKEKIDRIIQESKETLRIEELYTSPKEIVMQVSKSISTDALTKRLVTLAKTRVVEGKSDDKVDARYTSTVAELAKRTKKTPQQIRTMARRKARTSAEA